MNRIAVSAFACLAAGCVRGMGPIPSSGDSGRGRDRAVDLTIERPLVSGDRGGSDRPSEAGCARRVQATFCVDFEGVDPIGLGTWSEVDDGGGKGAIALTQVAFSPPNAASLRSIAAGSYNVLLTRSFAGAVSAVKAIAALRPDGEVIPMGWRMTQGGAQYFILGGLSSSTIEIHVQRFVPPTDLTELAYVQSSLPTSPFNLWTEVELAFESSPTRTARFRVGSAEVAAGVAAEVPFDSPSFVVGQWNSSAGRSVAVDDVAVWISR